MVYRMYMTLKLNVIIGAIIVALLGSSQIATATPNRPVINPDFDPDESCIIDIFQDKCDPGTEGECPEGFGQNGDGLCSHRTLVDGEWRWLCPEGYHDAWEDESGQCYPNDEGCRDDGFVLVEREDEDRNDQCAPLYIICDEEEVRNEDFCIEYCEENPDEFVCKPEAN